MKTIHDRLQEMTDKLSRKELFESVGLGNEINFHVFDYDPEDEYIVRDYLENYLLKKTNLSLKVFDIYEMIIEILKTQGFFEKCFEIEKEHNTKKLNTVILKSTEKGILEKIKNNIHEKQIIIITGISKCYGIIRGHTLLNKLHSVITNNPLLIFYPGTYTGQSFKLFNVLENDNYYRAFQFVDRK